MMGPFAGVDLAPPFVLPALLDLTNFGCVTANTCCPFFPGLLALLPVKFDFSFCGDDANTWRSAVPALSFLLCGEPLPFVGLFSVSSSICSLDGLFLSMLTGK